MPPIRINKYLSENHYCSRREADRLIEAGRVFLNGKRAQLGDLVSDTDRVRVEGRDKRKAPEKIYLLLHKPIGMSSIWNRRTNNVVNFVDYPEPVYPVGTLDKTFEGLVLLTDDRILANRMLKPMYEFDQEFVVEVDHPLKAQDIRLMQNGVKLQDGLSQSAKVRRIDDLRFAIILQEDPRQIRMICTALKYGIVSIKRTRLLSLKMPMNYAEGSWRHLTESEVRELKNAVDLK